MNFEAFKNKIWLATPTMHCDEMKYITEAFDTNWVVPLGPNVNGFEADLEKFVNARDSHVADAPQNDRNQLATWTIAKRMTFSPQRKPAWNT